VPERNIAKLIEPENAEDRLAETLPNRRLAVEAEVANLKRSCRLAQSRDVFVLWDGVQCPPRPQRRLRVGSTRRKAFSLRLKKRNGRFWTKR